MSFSILESVALISAVLLMGFIYDDMLNTINALHGSVLVVLNK